jgi:hypothetical protein
MNTMYILSWRCQFAVMGIAILAAAAGLGVGFGRGGDSPSPHAVAAPDAEEDKYVGARACERCHTNPLPKDKTDYVLLTEYKTWSEKDKHSQAYSKLTEPRSQQMGKILGWKVEEDARCLSCHAANISKKLQSGFDIRDGVSCEICHGPSYRWITPHWLDPKWRTKPAAEKQKLGMRNVRDPVELTRLCSSCHVGSVAEGKVVTHEMYAAGHPPLPSIEIATFCDKMPLHWRYLREKDKSIQQLIRETYKISAEEEERTKISLIGAVAAFQASMELLSDPADGGAKKEWIDRSPELANYDCYACHHELKTPSWRQKRGYDGPPGRPTMHVWPTILMEDAIRYANDPALAKQYDERMQKLGQAFGARPFGDPKQVATCAGQLREWSESLLQRLKEARYDSSSARRLVRGMCAAKDVQKYDYDSARQKAWAIDVILNELEPKQAERVKQSLADLRQQLKLDLPSGTKKQILSELPAHLQALNDYDPEKFKATLDKLGRSLSGE